MKGLLLGLADLIGDAIGAILNFVLMPILQLFFEWIINPIIKLVLMIVQYSLAAVMYFYAAFLLQLIDFVEILFRALAGLESIEASGMSLTLSLDGGEGDILIQLIRHPDIQAAFVSMCVVGLFLLVVTTVFQIIKVEYTTEGAKNAKGPIFQKAFKGLANLMLLPLLVIFGIVFANQLLGLLDRATKGEGDNPTISGMLWVTAASEAHYRPDDLEMALVPVPDPASLSLQGIIYAVVDIFDDWNAPETPTSFKYDTERVEKGFINQEAGYKYYNIGNVSKYYHFANVNYLLLFFGGVFVLKSLFYTCFGMVIRLYKCAVLFIIAPAVIGMTPVNEGGLGKWRTAFIGQVLSAYGTVLALNLFFVVVRVLLSIDVNFSTGGGSPVTGNDAIGAFGSSFMTALLKSIFVLAGCLLIEKFAKDLGGYFGADDAMAAGKDMSKQIGDTAMKGVQVAAMVGGAVATGGASLAMSAGSLAGKIGGKGKAIAEGAKEGGFKGAIRNTFTTQKHRDKVAHGKAQTAIADMTQENTGDKVTIAKNNARLERINRGLASDKTPEEVKARMRQEKRSLQNQNQLANVRIKNRDKDIEAEKKKMKPHEDNLVAKQAKKDERKDARARNLHNFGSMVTGLGEEGKKMLPGMSYFSKFGEARDKGAKKLGKEFEASNQARADLKEEKFQDRWRNAPIFKQAADTRDAIAIKKVTERAGEEMQAGMNKLCDIAQSSFKDYAQLLKGKDLNSTDSQKHIMDLTKYLQSQGSGLQFNEVKTKLEGAMNGKLDINLETLKIAFNPKDIMAAVEAAIKKDGLKPDTITKAIEDVVKGLGVKGEANIMKLIMDALDKTLSKMGK